ncbi:MAG: hypothetical protein J6J55_00230, partial [Paludibacteraceae bacterium]|nr:hypothetical protein [Paludibacteraceae bacterium]
PYFHTLESRQAPVVEMEGSRRIMLGSNNYLGFTEDPIVIEAGLSPHPSLHAVLPLLWLHCNN